MVYVEFNGIPGCGKSTVCGRLKNELLSREYRCIDFGEWKKANNYSFFNLILRTLCAGQERIFIGYVKMLLHLPASAPLKLKGTLASIKGNMLLLECIRTADAEILLADQGIVQDILSRYYNSPVENADGIKLIFETFFRQMKDSLLMEFDLSSKISAYRIENRASNFSRLDRMNMDKRLQLLEKQQSILEQIRELSADYCRRKRLNGEQSVEQSVNDIISEMNKLQLLDKQ